jgi:hypothetical protein
VPSCHEWTKNPREALSSHRSLCPNRKNTEDLKEEIYFRNSFINGTLVKVIHKCSEQDLGHVKLFFSSAAVRDEALNRNKIQPSYQLIKIVPIDVNSLLRTDDTTNAINTAIPLRTVKLPPQQIPPQQMPRKNQICLKVLPSIQHLNQREPTLGETNTNKENLQY